MIRKPVFRGFVNKWPTTSRKMLLRCHVCGEWFQVIAGGRRHGSQHIRKYCNDPRCRKLARQVAGINKRCRDLGVPGKLTAREWFEICVSYGWKCRGCGQQVETLQIDHIIPLSRGGHNIGSNVRPLCATCHKPPSLTLYDMIS